MTEDEALRNSCARRLVVTFYGKINAETMTFAHEHASNFEMDF